MPIFHITVAGLDIAGDVLTVVSLLAIITLALPQAPRLWRRFVVPASFVLTLMVHSVTGVAKAWYYPHVLGAGWTLSWWETLDLGSRAVLLGVQVPLYAYVPAAGVLALASWKVGQVVRARSERAAQARPAGGALPADGEGGSR